MGPCVLALLAASLSPGAPADIDMARVQEIDCIYAEYKIEASRFATLLSEREALVVKVKAGDASAMHELDCKEATVKARMATMKKYGDILRKDCERARKDGLIDAAKRKEICDFVENALGMGKNRKDTAPRSGRLSH